MRFNPKLNTIIDQNFTTKFENTISRLYIIAITQGKNALDCVNLNNPISLQVYEKLFTLGILKRNYDKTNTPLEIMYTVWISNEEADKQEGELNRRNIKGFLDENVKDYIKIFTKDEKLTRGLKPGVMGDEDSVKKKLITWMINNDYKYTWEQVLNATRAYVINQKSSNYKYLMKSHYFIYKNNDSELSGWVAEYGNISQVNQGNTFNI